MFEKDNRVKLKAGKQKQIFQLLRIKYGSLKQASFKFKISFSTFKKYAYESRLIPESLFNFLIADLNIDKSSFNYSILDANWGRKLGSKKGMSKLESKYPSKILEWRRLGRIRSAKARTHNMKVPVLNEGLSEFIGVYLGDGTLTKYYLKISGDFRYDLPYYSYLEKLVFDLFGLKSRIYLDKRSNAAYFMVFSKKLCSFINLKFGMKYGDKLRNNSLIPQSIVENNSFSLACLRGLVDTDGSVSKRGSQFTITFFSKNENLIEQIKNISERNQNIFTFFDKGKNTAGTNSKEKILNYFHKIGSSNLRHIVRFYEKFYNGNDVYQNEVVRYYQKDLYRDINLPFKTVSSSIG